MDTKARARYKIFLSDKIGIEMKELAESIKGKEFKPCTGGSWGKRNAHLIDQLKERWLFDDAIFLVCEISVLETFYDMKQNHQLQMMKDLGKAFEGKKNVDVTVKCGDASFECNKFMLIARSPVFEAMFQHETLESQTNVVNIEDVEPEVVEEILLYIQIYY